MPVVHEEKLRVNWVDTDASGRIHYTAALRYFEIAEHGLMRQLFGGIAGPGNRPFSLPRVHVEADFKLALRYPDEFTCRARVAHVGASSVSYRFEISDARGPARDRGPHRGGVDRPRGPQDRSARPAPQGARVGALAQLVAQLTAGRT